MEFQAEKLKELRKSKDLTISKLAELSGVSVNVIKNMELERRGAKLEYVKAICDTLEVPIETLYKRKTTVISIISHKGGVGKTTTSANLGYALSCVKKQNVDGLDGEPVYNKILLIDSDSQGNLTQSYGLGLDEEELDQKNFYQCFAKDKPIEECIVPTRYPNVDMVMYHDDLILLETQIIHMDYKEERMKQVLKKLVENGTYDYILVDCEPSVGFYNQSLVAGSDYVIIPMTPTTFAMRGIQHLVAFMRRIQQHEPHVEILGILFNDVNKVKSLTHHIYDRVHEKFGNNINILSTSIPTDAKIDVSQYCGIPVGANVKERGRRSAVYYEQLAEEVIEYVKG